MPRLPDNLDKALRAVEGGDLDALPPEDVADLADLLNDDPAAAARLADCRPVPEPWLAAALERSEQPDVPTAETWERVWARVDGGARAVPGRSGRAARIIRLWKPLMAAAACLLLAALWHTRSPAAAEPWPLQLATDAHIDQLEVYDGATAFVVTTGGENGFDVIWVLEDEG